MDVVWPRSVGTHRVLSQAEHSVEVVFETLEGTRYTWPCMEEGRQARVFYPRGQTDRQSPGEQSRQPPTWGVLSPPSEPTQRRNEPTSVAGLPALILAQPITQHKGQAAG